jgi:hypothetical protein
VSIDTGGGSWTDGDSDAAVTVAAQLNCPRTEGALDRVSAAADGQSCVYRKGDQEDVTLARVPLNGQEPRAALAPMEADLAGLVPVHAAPPPAAPEPPQADGDDRAKIDLPGVHIDTHGDKAKVSVLGVTVNADGDRADVHAGADGASTTVHAGPGGAEIRAGRVGDNSANLVYILAGDSAGPRGYRAVGYLARGPIAGPLIVGEFKARSGTGDHHDHDLEDLIKLNLHGAG